MYLKLAHKGHTQWWRYLLVFILTLIAKTISEYPILLLAKMKAAENNDAGNVGYYLSASGLEVSDNLYFALMFGPMVFVFCFLVISIHLVHGIPLKQIFTAYHKFRWKNFFTAGAIWFLLLALVELVSYIFNSEHYSFSFKGSEFFLLILFSFIFVPFQASAEELYFRGNILQGIGVLSGSRIISVLFSGILFGLMHIRNPEVAKFGLAPAMVQYIGFGVLLGIMVAMDGGLEMAFGMHTMNNIYLISFVSYSGSVLKTPSLFHTNNMDMILMTSGFILVSVVYLIILKKLFRWKPFNWLFERIDISEG